MSMISANINTLVEKYQDPIKAIATISGTTLAALSSNSPALLMTVSTISGFMGAACSGLIAAELLVSVDERPRKTMMHYGLPPT